MKRFLLICICALLPFLLSAQQYRVIISELMYDTPFPDESRPPHMHNGEFVSIYNYGDVPVNVSGWRLRSDGGISQTFIFPQGSIMQPGARFFVAYRSVHEPVNNFVLEDLFEGFQLGRNDRIFYENALRHANSGENLTLFRGNWDIQDRIRYDGTGPVVNNPPLRATNRTGIPGNMVVSLQRINVTVRYNETIGFNPLDWVTRTVALNRFPNSPLTEYVESVYTNSLQGVVNVTPSGALTFTIPIQVPVGTAGMQPQLAIVYNSQNNYSGILGVGFGLAGLSSISRVGQTFYHDGRRTGVDLTMDDRFALDGQRLIRTGGNTAIGTDGVIYDTEMASFSEILSYGHGSNNYLGPQGFLVMAKDGSSLYYGETSNSRIKHTRSGDTTVSQWLVSRIIDINGNQMSYVYHTGPGYASQIREIHYTSNPGMLFNSHNRIVFHYINKSVQRNLFVGGNPTPITDGKLLREIICYSGDSIVKRYRFGYNNNRLAYMREFSPCGRLLGELRFDWYVGQQRFADPIRWTDRFRSGTPDGWMTRWHPRMLADMSGNGKADIVGFSHNAVNVGLSSDRGIFQYAWWHQGEFSSGSGWDVDRHPRFAIDMNGDGIADVVGFGPNGVVVGISDGNGNLSVSTWTNSFSGSNWDDARRYPRFLADFNGDGLPDIIAMSPHSITVAINTGAGFSDEYISIGNFSAHNFNDTSCIALVGDITGDGRADIVHLRRNGTPFASPTHKHYGVSFAISNGDSFQENRFSAAFWNDHLWRDFRIPIHCRFNYFLQDVNGDGKADLIFTGRGGLYVALATGRGFLYPVRWTNNYGAESKYCDPRYKLLMADMNGDGMADLVAFDGAHVYVSLSTGNGFTTPARWNSHTFWGYSLFNGVRISEWFNHALVGFPPPTNNFRTLADVNGDGLPDLVGFGWEGVYVSLNLSSPAKLIGVSDNLGRLFTAQYNVLTDSAVYTKGPARALPLMSYQGPIRVCTRLTTRANDKFYTYEGAVVHLQGRGFLGFSRITETDSILQVRQITEFELDTNYFVNLPRRTQIFSTVNNQLISEHTQTNRIRPIIEGEKRILNEVLQITNRDFLTGIVQTSNFTYDAWGNVLSDTTFRGNAVFITRNTYRQTAFKTIPNRLWTTESYSYYTATPNNRISHKQHFTYAPRGNLIQIINRYGTSIADTTRYRVNAFGLATEITTSAPEITPKVQTFGHDPLYRFQTSQTIPGLGRTGQSFNAWGQILTDTAIGGQVTRYKYDVFGRLRRVISPNNIITTYTIRNERNTPGVVYTSTVQRTGQSDVRFFLDILGRTVKTETFNPYGGTVISESQFNDRGQLTRTSLPRFINETPRWTTFQYDNVGRLWRQTFQYLTTTHSYNGLTTTITPPAGTVQTSSRTLNTTGDLIRATDAGGAITYSYFVPGLVNRIVAPGNAVTTIRYDEFGRQISLHDPNAGVVEYQYDAFDRMIWQRSARGDTTFNEYDDWGRLERVIEGDRITTYSYFDYGYNVGWLQSITVNNGTAQIFEYDRFGRITKFKDVIGTDTLITRYTYCDVYGRLLTYTFPSGYRLYYHYVDNFKIRITDSYNNVIWNLHSFNALGQELESTVLGRHKRKNYDVFGRLRSHRIEGLIAKSYSYDNITGNMRGRLTDIVLNEWETIELSDEFFFYDNLNRLISSTYEFFEDTYHESVVEFFPNGNIRTKTNVGNYFYDPVRVHAVDSIFGALSEHLNHEITYTSFQKVNTIFNDNFLASFIYGPTRQRRQMTILLGDDVLTKHYTQNFEVSKINGVEKEIKEYIFSPFGLVAIRNNGVVNAVATDHLGSIVAKFNPRRGEYEFFGYTPWGRRYRYDFTYCYESNLPVIKETTRFFFDENVPENALEALDFLARGYTGHEHLDLFGLINMNGRLYDPIIARFLSPDPFVQAPTFTQSFNRYSYCFNNPLSYIDPTGEIAWFVPIIIGAAIWGTGNLVTNAIAGNVNHIGDGLKFFFQGAIVGAALGATWTFAPLIPTVGQGIQTGMSIYGIAQVATGAIGMIGGAIDDGWGGMGRAGKIFLGNFYLDYNFDNPWEGMWKGFTRHTWESLQVLGGHGIAQVRNMSGNVDRVEYKFGATFAISENVTGDQNWWGASWGNFNFVKLRGQYAGLTELFWHEFGHTFQSRRWGPLYLLAIGIPSAAGARWTEDQADRFADRFRRRRL